MKSAKVFQLYLILLSLAVGSGHSTDPEYLFRMKTWGGLPLTSAAFQVDLRTDGLLIVQKRDYVDSKESKKIISIQMESADAARLHGLAQDALKTKDFQKGCNAVADGTNARMTVWSNERVMEAECWGAAKWPAKGTNAEKLLRFINSKLREDMQVY